MILLISTWSLGNVDVVSMRVFNVETLELLSYKYGNMRDGDIRRIQDYFLRNPDDLATLRDEYERLR